MFRSSHRGLPPVGPQEARLARARDHADQVLQQTGGLAIIAYRPHETAVRPTILQRLQARNPAIERFVIRPHASMDSVTAQPFMQEQAEALATTSQLPTEVAPTRLLFEPFDTNPMYAFMAEQGAARTAFIGLVDAATIAPHALSTVGELAGVQRNSVQDLRNGTILVPARANPLVLARA